MAYPNLEELNLLHDHICRALGDPKRLLILYALHAQPLHVTALADGLGLPQPTISRHLNLLRNAGLVSAERQGAAVIYSLCDARIITVIDTMRAVLRDSLLRHSTTMS